MVVTGPYFENLCRQLGAQDYLSLDTETTGLNPWLGDRLFSIIINDGKESYYFNFQKYPESDPLLTLDPTYFLPQFNSLFRNPSITWFMHNAKFDLAMLYQENLKISGEIHCTAANARVECNCHLDYSLESCGARLGEVKSRAVEEYIRKHKLFEMVLLPGKKKRVAVKFYNRVPLDVIRPYAETDARITYKLGMQQVKSIAFQDEDAQKKQKLSFIFRNEKDLTKTCFEMERHGIQIDRSYCQGEFDRHREIYSKAEKDFKSLTGLDFMDSSHLFKKVWDMTGDDYPFTQKGSPSFDDKYLATLDCHPIARSIQDYRSSYKIAQTYYANFLYHADKNDVIHPNMRQGGTATGRFSYSDPNLQNIPSPEDGDISPVRKAFIPRPGYFFAMLDYDQMEYRMMLDYADERELIERVKAGMDLHDATREVTGVATRKIAKTLNFAILYGSGVANIAAMLGISETEARDLRSTYFRNLPNVQRFIRDVTSVAKFRKWIFNWAGRRYTFLDSNRSYIAPNYVCQGGCADVVKIAMNEVGRVLRGHRSRMILQVHDELVFEMHEDETALQHKIIDVMEGVYPGKNLSLTVSIAHSDTNWGDKKVGAKT